MNWHETCINLNNNMKRTVYFFLFSLMISQVFAACKLKNSGTANKKSAEVEMLDIPVNLSRQNDTPKIDVKASFQWYDFETGFAKAEKENKFLLVDVYTDWCGWCKVMDRNTYSNDTVIGLINKEFIAVKLNPEISKNYTMGDRIMSADELHHWLGYGKTFGYPTTYFMIQPGKTEERYAQVGYMDAKEFSGILNIVIGKKQR